MGIPVVRRAHAVQPFLFFLRGVHAGNSDRGVVFRNNVLSNTDDFTAPSDLHDRGVTSILGYILDTLGRWNVPLAPRVLPARKSLMRL